MRIGICAFLPVFDSVKSVMNANTEPKQPKQAIKRSKIGRLMALNI